MAVTPSFLATPFFLLSLLLLASATDYSYDPKPQPDNVKPNEPEVTVPKPDVAKPTEYYNPKPEPHVANLDYIPKPEPQDTVKPDYGSNPKPEPHVPKPDYIPKPEPQETIKPDYGFNPKPKLDTPKPDYTTESKPETNRPGGSYNPKHKLDYIPKPNPESVKHVYGDIPKPNPESVKPDYKYNPKPEVYEPKLAVPKPEADKQNDGYKPEQKVESVKPAYDHVPKPKYDKPDLTGPKLEKSKLDNGYGPAQEQSLPAGIEGLVLCKSGSSYAPIEGAVVKISCKGVDQNRYDTKPVSCEAATDAKGYFIKRLDSSEKMVECKAYLEKSPLESCKYGTDVNKGMTGAILSSFRVLNDKHVKLYSVGPFFYSSKPASTPAGY